MDKFLAIIIVMESIAVWTAEHIMVSFVSSFCLLSYLLSLKESITQWFTTVSLLCADKALQKYPYLQF
jgi:hypothetical protein